jgi:hypothetical protein
VSRDRRLAAARCEHRHTYVACRHFISVARRADAHTITTTTTTSGGGGGDSSSSRRGRGAVGGVVVHGDAQRAGVVVARRASGCAAWHGTCACARMSIKRSHRVQASLLEANVPLDAPPRLIDSLLAHCRWVRPCTRRTVTTHCLSAVLSVIWEEGGGGAMPNDDNAPASTSTGACSPRISCQRACAGARATPLGVPHDADPTGASWCGGCAAVCDRA